jgi:hypothetical protein
MPRLLHEYWESDEGYSDFGPVSEEKDRLRPSFTPHARLVFSVRAASWAEAMQLYNKHMGFGDYVVPDGTPSPVYTSQEAAEQKAYLQVRPPFAEG